MKDSRVEAVARIVELRYPGTRVVLQPLEDPEDPGIRWRMRILNVAPKRVFEAQEFARQIGEGVYGGWERCPFYVRAMDRRDTRRFLARRKEEAAASRRPRLRRPARAKARHPAAARGRVAG